MPAVTDWTTPPESVPPDVFSRLRGFYPGLSPSEKKVADFILENYEAVIRMPLAELAFKSGVSEATAVRLCRSLGYPGFLDLKLALTRLYPNTPQLIHDDISPDDSPDVIVRKVFQGDIQAINDTLAVLDTEAFSKAIMLVEGARKVLIVGVGTSGPMTHELFNRLIRLGINCQIQTDSYLQVMQTSLLTAEDVIIIISQTGDSQDPIRTAMEAHLHQIPVITITGNALSPLAEKSDVVLLSVSHETRPETISSRVAQHALIQALYVALALRSVQDTVKKEQMIWDALMRIPPYQNR
jgi:DNA-binding MurR/RpiR family transcriptional regulator